MQRRRYRVGSATMEGETRLNPALLLLVLAVGVMAGFVCANPGQLVGTASSREEQYLVLTATLYAQGEHAAAIKQRLLALGYKNPSVVVLKAADRLQESSDPQAQRQAEQLRQLSDALTVAGDTVPPSAAAQPTTQPPAPGASTIALQQTQPAPAEGAPAAPATAPPADQAQSPAAPASGAAPAPAPAAAPQAAAPAAPLKSGTVKTSNNEPAVLRVEPNTKSGQRALVPTGAKVQIIETVTGEPADGSETRWYRVKYGQLEGFVYFRLLVPGD